MSHNPPDLSCGDRVVGRPTDVTLNRKEDYNRPVTTLVPREAVSHTGSTRRCTKCLWVDQECCQSVPLGDTGVKSLPR